VRSALAEGKVVVFDDCLVTANGTVRIETNIAKPVELPAYRAERAPSTTHFGEEYLFLPGAFISAHAAAALGWGTFANAVVATHPASADVAAMRSAADAAGVDTFVEESVSDRVTNLSLALAGIAALVALLGAAVTVALAAADGRSDLATLAALGAQPRRRRTLVGAQALVVTGVGTLAGLVVGGCVGFAATPLAGVPRLAIPWNYLLLTAVCVPLVATIVAMVATPSRLPMIVRRQS
jgi:putative ABC transport system permease protein